MLHISCNMGTRDLPDMYALGPLAQGLSVYISGKSLMPMLQLLNGPVFTRKLRSIGDTQLKSPQCSFKLPESNVVLGYDVLEIN